MTAHESQVLAFHTTRLGAEKLKELVSTSRLANLAGLDSSLEEFEAKVLQHKPEIVLIEYQPGYPGMDSFLERLAKAIPRATIMAWSSSREADDIMTAMRLGVREYLAEPVPEGAFNEAVLRLRQKYQAAQRPTGKMVSVLGAKGGVGASHLAINLAWSFSQIQGRKVALVDFDRSGGDLAFMLDLEPEKDLTDVAQNVDRLDSVFLEGLLVQVAPGMNLLAAPADQASAEEVDVDYLGLVLDNLAASHQIVVTDTSSRLDEVSLLALDRAEKVLLVVEPSLVGLKSGRRLLSLCDRLGYGPGKIMVVVNRSDARGSVKPRDAEAALGRSVGAWLPNDTLNIMDAANSGTPVLKQNPKATWAKAVSKLAREIERGLGPAEAKGSDPARKDASQAKKKSGSKAGLLKGFGLGRGLGRA